jgi:transposase
VKVNPKKMKKTAIGFQAINGKPHLKIGNNINTGLLIEFFVETKELNSEFKETKEFLRELSAKENIQDEYIKNCILQRSKNQFIERLNIKIKDKLLTKEELAKKLQTEINKENSKDKRKISKIKSQNMILNLIKKLNINIDKNTVTNYVKLKNFVTNEELMNKKIKNYFPSEKRICIILDNYSVHIAYLTRLAAKILNIELINLPSYSPNLNPIEQLWRTLKKELYTKYIENEEFLTQRFTKIFYKIINRPSFTKKWKEKYIAKN